MTKVQQNMNEKYFDELWKKVDEAEKQHSLETAIKELDAIYEKAVNEKNYIQTLKAIFKKSILKINSCSLEDFIVDLEQVVKTTEKEIQPMLNMMLAKSYYIYFCKNRYELYDRSTTAKDADLTDFRTWDLPRLFTHISKLYYSVLDDEELLSKIPITQFDGILNMGNQPIELRSNLFEFFVHEALKFYCDEVQSTVNPKISFEIEADSEVFGTIDEFINWNPENINEDSCNHKALKLFQRLLSLNKENNNENALIYNNIERICWAKKVAVGQEKNERYISALKQLIEDYPDNEYSARVLYLLAKHYNNEEEYVKAIDYAEKAYKKWPESQSGKASFNIIEEIKRPSIYYSSETIFSSNTIKIKGRAFSYTGAAIDNAEVKYKITRKCTMIFENDTSQEIGYGTTITNDKGEFEISFVAYPNPLIDSANNPIFEFSVTADITDNTGETRSGATKVKLGYSAMVLTIFTNDKNFKFSLDSNDIIDADKEIKFTINSLNHNYEHIKAKGKFFIYELVKPNSPERLPYWLSDFNLDKKLITNMKEGKVLLEERFSTDENGVYLKKIKLPEGIYRIKAESKDKFGKEIKKEEDIIALSYSSDKMSVKLPFFFEIISSNLKPGDTFKAFWATGYDQGPAYIEICHRNNVLKSYWTDPNKNKEFIYFPVTQEMRGGFYVKVFQVKENRFYETDRHINVSWSNKDLKLKLVHFTSNKIQMAGWSRLL